MDKVVLIMLRLEECYDKGEGYYFRQNIMSDFYENLRMLLENNDSDKVLLSFFSDYSWDDKAVLTTELSMNMKEKDDCIMFGKNFYQAKNKKREIYQYIKDLSKKSEISRVIYIDYKPFLNIKAADSIRVDNGFKSLVAALGAYSKNQYVYELSKSS